MSAVRQESFETAQAPELELRLAAGEVELETHDEPRTVVEVEPLDDAGEEMLGEVRIELRDTGGRPRLLIDVPEKRRARLTIEHRDRSFGFLHKTPSFAVRVTAPAGLDASVRSKSADISSRGVLGALDVKSQSGDVEAREVQGRAAVHTASGDVELGLVGSVEVNTVSGDVRVTHAAAEARANSVSGDVDVRRADASAELTTVSGDVRLVATGGGNLTLQSVSGDVNVGIVQGVDVWLDVRSMSGDTSSDLEAADGPEGERPSIELRANTVSGDVRISRTVAVV